MADSDIAANEGGGAPAPPTLAREARVQSLRDDLKAVEIEIDEIKKSITAATLIYEDAKSEDDRSTWAKTIAAREQRLTLKETSEAEIKAEIRELTRPPQSTASVGTCWSIHPA